MYCDTIKIKLESGITVSVEGYELGYTYGGLLEGRPWEELNRKIFDRTTSPSNWGERKILKIEPTEYEFKNCLKPVYHVVWLICRAPSDPEYHGSELVVVWFDNYPNGKTIEGIIEEGVKFIDWYKSAQDFCN